MKKPTQRKTSSVARSGMAVPRDSDPDPAGFAEIVHMIRTARHTALREANAELVKLYWNVGQYISRKLDAAEWGDKVVDQLAVFISRHHPDLKGFTRRNLFRMRQFHELYRDGEIVSPLVTPLSWTHHLLVMSACKNPDEREFYLRLAASERWSKRDLERQLKGALFQRMILNPPKAAAALHQVHPDAAAVFKDSYLLEFLDLPDTHTENDLQRALVANLRKFLIELGADFCFIGEQKRLSVGGRDFFLDLLFFHRGLNCLVVFELKIEEFQPEHLGKLEFYLEAVDRDMRKPHENPTIGVLLCATKDNEIVEFALNRSASPTLIAEYQTQLPDRALLQRKLHEFYEQALPDQEFDTWLSESVGIAKGMPSTDEMMRETRGED